MEARYHLKSVFHLIESLRMGARYMSGISDVNDVHHRTNDVLYAA